MFVAQQAHFLFDIQSYPRSMNCLPTETTSSRSSERRRVLDPPYLNKVRYVFKTYGFEPWCGASLSEQSPASVLKCIRDWVFWSWRYLSICAERFSPRHGAGKMVLPLGTPGRRISPASPLNRAATWSDLSAASKTGHIRSFRPRGWLDFKGHRPLADGQFCKSWQLGRRRASSTARPHLSRKARCRTPAIATRRSWPTRRSLWRREAPPSDLSLL